MTSASSPQPSPPQPPPSSPPLPPRPPPLPLPPAPLPCGPDPPAAECASASPAKIDVSSSNGVVHDEFDEMPESSHFKVLDRKEQIEKYQRYKSEYTRLLMVKYFSSKNIYGGNVYEETMTIGDETIMSSRWPSTQSFADPMKDFHEQKGNDSVSTEKTPSNISNGDVPLEKND